MCLSSAELAIARSVIYASLFDYPLTLDQLRQTLIESVQTNTEILRTFRASAALQAIVEYRDGFFFPAGRRALVDDRMVREARSRAFLKRHRRLLSLICALPYTRMVALSGSIAHLNLEEDGDLDLFIVTRGERVWSVTVAILLIARLLRSRRVLCANLVVADSHLAMENEDLFTANQIIHLRPLIGGELMGEFLRANAFVAGFYPNIRSAPERVTLRRRSGADILKSAIEHAFNVPSKIVEAMCRRLYGRHLKRRAAGWRSPEQVQLRPDYLKLHSHSHKRSVLDRFDQAMSDALDRASVVAGAAAPPHEAVASATRR